MESFREFSNKILKRGSTKGKKCKITNSYILEDIYKRCKKDGLTSLTYKEFATIVKTVNLIQRDRLYQGFDIRIPFIGRIVLYKKEVSPKYINGKLRPGRAINWGRTLKLWYEDPEAKAAKIRVRSNNSEIFKPIFERVNFNNLRYYTYSPARQLLYLIHYHIKYSNLEAPLLKTYYGIH